VQFKKSLLVRLLRDKKNEILNQTIPIPKERSYLPKKLQSTKFSIATH
jgi:hypothetical protein